MPSERPMPCSLGVPRSEVDIEIPGSKSLGLFDLIGLVLGALAGDAEAGGPRGC